MKSSIRTEDSTHGYKDHIFLNRTRVVWLLVPWKEGRKLGK